MTKTLIIGSNGNAGHMIHAYLKGAGYLVSSLARNNADYIVNIETKKDLLALKNIMSDFDYVINCAGVLVSASQDKPERAMLLNSFLPQYIASCLSATKTKLIHLSTDCVFSGTDHGGYAVTRLPDERQTYGFSKSLGEVNNAKDLTLRMSYIGPEISEHASGLLDWFLNLEPGSTIVGWKNHFWSGITTLELAKIIEMHISTDECVGLHNLSRENFRISKYDLLRHFREVFQKDITINPIEHEKNIDKSLIRSLPNETLPVKPFNRQLVELREWMVANKQMYRY